MEKLYPLLTTFELNVWYSSAGYSRSHWDKKFRENWKFVFFMFLREDNEMLLCCNKIHENVQMNAKINFFALLIYFAPAETWHGDINVNFIVNLRMI